MLLNVAKDAYLNNFSLLNCFMVFLSHQSLKILPAKPLATLHFIHVSMGHVHFLNNEICISCESDRPTLAFSVVKCQ